MNKFLCYHILKYSKNLTGKGCIKILKEMKKSSNLFSPHIIIYHSERADTFYPMFSKKLRHYTIHLFCILMASICLNCRQNSLDVNISGIDLDIPIRRFETELFSISTDNIAKASAVLYGKYDDFLDIFSYHVISIGLPSEREYPGHLAMFLSDRLNREVYQETMRLYPGLDDLEKTFTRAFKRYRYHFPQKEIPEPVSFISRFNFANFTVGNYIGIGLDMYLGADHEFYIRLGLPEYQRMNMFREKIPSDAIYAFAGTEIPYNDSVDNLLGRIIHHGILMYFVDALLPDQSDSLKIGFSANQMKWCSNNERQMWEYLIEHKLLFSTDPMVIRKITGPAPFTYYFTGESPGRTGVWIGWHIVREYARRNRDLTLREIIYETDYQKILREARYNP